MSDSGTALPPTHAPRACKRCSIHKKKCDRLIPRCTGCVLASVPCEASVKSADRRLVRQVNELRDENADLKRQIASLQRELGLQHRTDESERRARTFVGASMDPIESSVSFTSSRVLPLPPLFTANHYPILSRHSRQQALSSLVFTSFGLQIHDPADELDDQDQDHDQDETSSTRSTNRLVSHEVCTPTNLDVIPSLEETCSIIRSLLESAKHGPSNLDKIIEQTQLEEDCRLVYGPDGLLAPEYASNRFRCFITVYLAMCMTAAVNGEDITADARAMACRSLGMKELPSVISREDLNCVEALTLLCELAIHEPNGSSLWQLVGLAGRTAVAINLHRRDDIYMPTAYPSWPACDEDPSVVSARNRRRKDLFWAFYSLDRLTMFTLNRPASIKDEDIDVDLPPLTMWPEGKYATASSEALWVHHLQARRLYGQIQGSLYAASRSSERDSTTPPEEIVSRYVHQVQQWYMWSRFNATVVPFSDDSVKRHLLDDIQYHQIMMALHQPSPLIPRVSSTFIATLKRSASLSVNLFHHSASRKQLNVHWVNMYHFFTSSAILIYCFREHHNRPDLVAVPDDEVAEAVARCQQTLHLFRGASTFLVARYGAILARIVQVFELQQQQQQPEHPTEQTISPSGDIAPPSGQSQPDSGQGSAFDIDMIVNGLLREGQFPNMTSSPTFAEQGMSSELANFMLPEAWTAAPGHNPKSSSMQAQPHSDVEENIGSV